MRVSIESKGDWEDTMNWLSKIRNRNPDPALEEIGRQGLKALQVATPKDTGVTANSWSYKVNRKFFGAEIAWFNNAHQHTGVSIVLLKQFGHGTGTGGYVPPYDFINPALSSIFASAGKQIIEEMFK